jgi:hypothetical protein
MEIERETECMRCHVPLLWDPEWEVLPAEVFCSDCARMNRYEKTERDLAEANAKVEAQRIVLADTHAEIKELREKLNETQADLLSEQESRARVAKTLSELTDRMRIAFSEADLAKAIETLKALAYDAQPDANAALETIMSALLIAAFDAQHHDACWFANDDDSHDPSPCTCGVAALREILPVTADGSKPGPFIAPIDILLAEIYEQIQAGNGVGGDLEGLVSGLRAFRQRLIAEG